MDYIETSGLAIEASFMTLWTKFISFIPELLGALIVLIIGLILAGNLGRIAKKVASFAKVDHLLSKLGVSQKLKEHNFDIKFSDLLGFPLHCYCFEAVSFA